MNNVSNYNLEEITKKIEEIEQAKKRLTDQYDIKIAQLTEKKKALCSDLQQEIDAAIEIQKLLIGDNEQVETESFIIHKKHPNLKSKAAYKLVPPDDKKQKEEFIEYLRTEHEELLKENISYKPIQNDIKKLIIDGVFNLTDEGLLIDDNGIAIPHLIVDVKDIELKVKVKQS